MALGDFRVVSTGGGEPVAHKYQAKAAGTSIKAGEFVTQGTSSDVEYVIQGANGASSALVWVGVAATTSTETAAADGEVWVYDDPEYIFAGKATTFANLSEASILTEVTLDRDSSSPYTQTVDENDTSSGTLRIMGYDSNLSEVYVKMASPDHLFSK